MTNSTKVKWFCIVGVSVLVAAMFVLLITTEL